MVIIPPGSGLAPTTLEGACRDAHLAKRGLQTDKPGVDISYASILATGCDIRALELLRFHRDLHRSIMLTRTSYLRLCGSV